MTENSLADTPTSQTNSTSAQTSRTHMIQNPILTGFNPDPSIVRVGDDYYIATSTFEWYPGVQLHHSQDDSGGIWAPCLSYADGLFHLIFTDVKTWSTTHQFKDTHNYLTTAPTIDGPWSAPIYLNSSGFDPSLFLDDDGRKWFTNMLWDHRKGHNPFAGILLQEYDPEQQTLVGPVKNIFQGSELGLTEAPHLYKKDGWYYLVTAEGGTSYDHAITVARSQTLEGPYQLHPDTHLLTARNDASLEIQKAGHGSFVETQTGEWYVAHLCGRPLTPRGACNLGRETALQKLVWKDGWPYLEHGGQQPQLTVPAPNLPAQPQAITPEYDQFDSPMLGLHWQTLRAPHDDSWLSLTERPGHLRLYGRESLISRHRQSLVGRRLKHHHAEAETCVEFSPATFQQMAGLATYYQTDNWVYLRVSWDESLGKSLNILSYDNGMYDEALEQDISLDENAPVYLRVRFTGLSFQFGYTQVQGQWEDIGPTFEAGKLSDDYCQGLSFTGTFIALCCQDLSGQAKPADFAYFRYRERK